MKSLLFLLSYFLLSSSILSAFSDSQILLMKPLFDTMSDYQSATNETEKDQISKSFFSTLDSKPYLLGIFLSNECLTTDNRIISLLLHGIIKQEVQKNTKNINVRKIQFAIGQCFLLSYNINKGMSSLEKENALKSFFYRYRNRLHLSILEMFDHVSGSKRALNHGENTFLISLHDEFLKLEENLSDDFKFKYGLDGLLKTLSRKIEELESAIFLDRLALPLINIASLLGISFVYSMYNDFQNTKKMQEIFQEKQQLRTQIEGLGHENSALRQTVQEYSDIRQMFLTANSANLGLLSSIRTLYTQVVSEQNQSIHLLMEALRFIEENRHRISPTTYFEELD